MRIRNAYILVHYLKYRHKIYNFFWYRVGCNNAIAEDLTAEAFLKALAKFETFDRNQPFIPWLYAIARNLLKNHYRKNGREVPIDMAELLPDNCTDQTQAKIDTQYLLKVVDGMDEYHREVLFLKYIDGLTNNEIAQILEKDEGAVRTQLSRAHSVLRNHFEAI